MKSVKIASTQNKYYIGLDIGTNSVGFCAANTNYDILTKGNHLQAGARLFEEAQDAKTRREKRSARRRLARRKLRIKLLQQLFSPVINDSFFYSLSESNLIFDDKNSKNKYSLFNDSDFTDVDFYKKFPTIYHLRHYLCSNPVDDIRLIYLACHHMMKSRGHFLFDEFSVEQNSTSYKDLLIEFNDILRQSEFEINNVFHEEDIDLNSLMKEATSVKNFMDLFFNEINPTNDKLLRKITDIIRGNKINIEKLWTDKKEVLNEIELDLKEFRVTNEKFDELLSTIINTNILNDVQISLLVKCKELSDKLTLNYILKDSATMAEAMVEKYNKHHKDLHYLKTFLKKYCTKEQYFEMFKEDLKSPVKASTYSHYIGINKTNNNKSVSHISFFKDSHKSVIQSESTDYEDFIKYVQQVIKSDNNKINFNFKDSEEYEYIINAIESGDFCLKSRNKDNAIFPNQLVAFELETILRTQQKRHSDFITEELISNLKKILTFRIPYYVGPLSDLHADQKDGFAWIVRTNKNSHVPITPLNFEEEVDLFKSGEKFINRMISFCTYIRTENVLPKESLLYQEFELLNDLNNLKINGNRITQDLKIFLYENLCQKGESLTKNKIEEYLIDAKKVDSDVEIGKNSELDDAFNSSLSSLKKCKSILKRELSACDIEMCENIIVWHTIFGKEKSPISERIKNEYGSLLTDEQIKLFVNLSFSGWGRLSKKFLMGIKTYQSNPEESVNIITELRNTTCNLMELLNSNRYQKMFLDVVRECNGSNLDKVVTYDTVKELYCSPSVKRSIWQAILVVKDLVKANGNVHPKKIFVEVTRHEDIAKKNKLQSARKQQIQNLYKDIKKISEDYDLPRLKKELEEIGNDQLRSDKIYFYFTQLGKCMYSEAKLDLDDILAKRDTYDIDHIYPQAKVLDNSLDNRVLVLKDENHKKAEKYPLNIAFPNKNKEFWEKMKNFWKRLETNKLISREKYERLISNIELSEDQIAGFINRQLVSTNQAVKSVCELLKRIYPNTEIVFSKAEHVSKFRQLFNITKCRDVNDLHHAHDAYLNIVVGNVWSETFKHPSGNESAKLIRVWKRLISDYEQELERNKQSESMLRKDLDPQILAARLLFVERLTNSEIWGKGYLEKVKSYTINCHEKFVNKYLVVKKLKEKKGKFYKETVHHKHPNNSFPRKKGLDVSKYGGFRDVDIAYVCLIEYTNLNKGLLERSFCKVPVVYSKIEDMHAFLKSVCEFNNIETELNSVKVLYPKILINSVFEIDGLRYLIRDGDLNCNTTCQWYPAGKIVKIIKDVGKFLILAKQTSSKDVSLKNFKWSEDDLIYVFDKLCDQLRKGFYKNYQIGKRMEEGVIKREKFVKLEIKDKCEIIYELLANVSHINNMSELVKIGGKGIKTCWRKARIIDKKVYLISQSPTGLFEQKIPLLNC